MSAVQEGSGTDRRQFLRRSAATGAGMVAGMSGLGLLGPSFAAAKSGGVTSGDVAIVGAAQIAEALAVTTYTNIIDRSPFFKRLPDDDQGYLIAARQEEMSHYALEKSVTGKPSPFTTFYYPSKMFSDAQTTLDRPRHPRGRLHRGLPGRSAQLQHARPAGAVGADHGHRDQTTAPSPVSSAATCRAKDGGPIKKITGVQGKAESADPPNNNGYERTLKWTKISQAVDALTPFADKAAAAQGRL